MIWPILVIDLLAGYNLDQIEIAKVSPGLHQFYNSGSLGVESSETIDDLYTHRYIKNLPPNHHYKQTIQYVNPLSGFGLSLLTFLH